MKKPNKLRSHKPNHIPLNLRWFYGLSSTGLLIYGTYGLWIDDLYLPGKRGRGAHLHGLEAWLMYGAFICLAANFLSVVVDHFDKRNNEHNYRRFARVSSMAGWSFFAASLVAMVGRAFTS